ncbi:hypothetical protein R1sor_005045 [Riccia sorocarpa]|uniref:Uncharacterized protein n=1 Tax=Riccia sorocarpa TaxID=122646 RepID=A0ABD3HLY9_9MARC
METGGIEGLETLCRQFLWGWTDQESPKASLIAWERIAQGKADGGLGWNSLGNKARALQVRNVIKIMNGSKEEWSMLAKSFILRTLRCGKYQRERRQWRLPEALLFTAMGKIHGSRTLTRIMTAWNKVRLQLVWDDSCKETPEHLTIEQGLRLSQWGNREEPASLQKIARLLSKGGIHTLKDGEQVTRDNRSWRGELAAVGTFPDESENAKIQHLEEWLRSKSLVNKELHEVDGWREESLEHTFWECNRLARRLEEMEACEGIPGGCNSLIEWVDKALAAAKNDTSYLWLLGNYLAITWSERNELKFNGKRIYRPTRGILRRTLMEIEAFPSSLSNERQLAVTKAAKLSVQSWMITCERRARIQLDWTEAEYLSATDTRSSPQIAAAESNDTESSSDAETTPRS